MMELNMKAKRTLFVAILCLVGLSSFAGEVFGSLYYLGSINENSIQFYNQKNGSWVHKPDQSLTIPAGSKSVFSVGTWVGAVVDNTVQFFSLTNGSWIHMTDYDLAT